jgi:hypothetical protein
VKVLLGCLALIVVVLALANFVVFNTTGDAAMPIYVSHPLGMLTVVYLVFVFVVPTMLGRPSARVLPAAGPPTAMFRSGGRLGRVNFSGRLIKVTVHRDRLVLRPFLLGEYTIHGSEIRSVIDLGGMMFRRVQIEHAGPGLFSRVVLRSVPDHARTQIGHIARNPLPPGLPTPTHTGISRTTGRRFTSILFVVGFLLCLGFVAFGVVQFARYQEPFLLVWAAAMLAATVVVVREFVKFRRRA